MVACSPLVLLDILASKQRSYAGLAMADDPCSFHPPPSPSLFQSQRHSTGGHTRYNHHVRFVLGVSASTATWPSNHTAHLYSWAEGSHQSHGVFLADEPDHLPPSCVEL